MRDEQRRVPRSSRSRARSRRSTSPSEPRSSAGTRRLNAVAASITPAVNPSSTSRVSALGRRKMSTGDHAKPGSQAQERSAPRTSRRPGLGSVVTPPRDPDRASYGRHARVPPNPGSDLPLRALNLGELRDRGAVQGDQTEQRRDGRLRRGRRTLRHRAVQEHRPDDERERADQAAVPWPVGARRWSRRRRARRRETRDRGAFEARRHAASCPRTLTCSAPARDRESLGGASRRRVLRPRSSRGSDRGSGPPPRPRGRTPGSASSP